jgi:hypothetical protein
MAEAGGLSIPMTKHYRFQTIPITKGEAGLIRSEQIKAIRREIAALLDEIEAIEASPLPTTKLVRQEIPYVREDVEARPTDPS